MESPTLLHRLNHRMKPLNLIPIGVAVVIVGILTIFIGTLLAARGGKADTEAGAKVAVGGFIGPILFGFGNDKTLLYAVIALSVVALLAFALFRLLAR